MPTATACGSKAPPPPPAGVPADPSAANAPSPAAAPSQQAGDDADQPAPADAKEVLRRLCDFYRHCKAFQVDYVQSVTVDSKGIQKTVELAAKLTVERPNRFALRHDNSYREELLGDWELWVAADRQPRVLQASFDLTKSLPAGAAGREAVVVHQYKNWQFDAPLPTDAFVFQPLPGATKAEIRYSAFTLGQGERETPQPLVKPAQGRARSECRASRRRRCGPGNSEVGIRRPPTRS